VVSDKGPGSWTLQKRIPTKTKSGETGKVLLKGKTSTARVHGRMGGFRERVAELCSHGSWHYFYGAFLPVFLWPIILICLVHNPYLVRLRIPPCVRMRLLAKMDFTKKASG